ncbi:MAG: hypothetical protein OSB30_06630 [Candidatus Poseidoniaceae archaeon]|nr:hypothetical protein [Candidatus Poseidoniaceae archaeon]
MATIFYSIIPDGKINNAIADIADFETLMAGATANHSAPKN